MPEQNPPENDGRSALCNYGSPAPHRIREWLKHPRAWVEILTLCFVGFYACLTYQLVNNVKREFAASERPWVGLGDNFWLNSNYHVKPSDRPLTIPVNLKNAGKIPALHTEPLLFLVFGSYAPDTYPWSEDIVPDLNVCDGMQAGHKRYMEISILPQTEYQFSANPVVVTSQNYDSMTSKKSTLYVVGCIYYKDPAGNRYKTDVCLYYSLIGSNPGMADGRFKFCPAGNETMKNDRRE
jgi:hypothetical protein